MEAREFTTPAGYFPDSNPAFSPDGQTLAFIRWPDTILGDTYLQPVVGVDKQLVNGDGALSVSPDGQWVLYPQIDRVESHIMLVENFR